MLLNYELIGKAIGEARNEANQYADEALAKLKEGLSAALSEARDLTAAEARAYVDEAVETVSQALHKRQDELAEASHEYTRSFTQSELEAIHKELTERIEERALPGEKGERGDPGLDGIDRPLVTPVTLVTQKDYPKNTVGTFGGGLWISTKEAVGDPQEDPHAWECVLDGIADVEVKLQEDHTYQLNIRMGTGSLFTHDFEIPFPEHVGIWEEGKAYKPGQIVTKATAMWMALQDTDKPPPANGWRQILTAPRGKAGPAGKSIVGPQGKPGRNGRDAELPEGFLEEIEKLARQNKRFIDGRSGAEAITAFRGYFDQGERYRSGDVVNSGGDIYLCTSGGTFKSIAESSANWELLVHVPKPGFTPYMLWKGEWIPGSTHDVGHVVRDAGWTMVANKKTDDRPAPQGVGEAAYPYTGTLTGQTSSSKQLIAGQRYTPQTRAQIVSGYRLNVTTGIHYQVFLVRDALGTPILNEVNNFTASSTGWVSFNLNQIVLELGKVADMMVVVTEPDGTPTIWSGNWNYTTPNNVAVPAAGEILHANQATSELRINKTDSDAGDRETELLALTVGDHIQGGGQDWVIQSITDQGTWILFGVSPASQGGPDGIQNFDFQTVTATLLPYGDEADAWLGNAGIQGMFGADTAYADIVPDDNQYIVDVLLQDYIYSEDWEIVTAGQNVAGTTAVAAGWPPGGGHP